MNDAEATINATQRSVSVTSSAIGTASRYSGAEV
jgi:hypothetical protein